jgi:hypothetical protein
MSLRPAVLYDHVPTAIPDDDDEDDEDKNKETLGVSYYVSKMVHRVSAPLAPRQEKDNNNSCGVQQFQVLEGEQGDDDDNNGSDHDEEYRDETIGKNDDDHYHDKDESESDDDDDDLRPMETIIEDTDSDYIIIPIPSSAAMTTTTTTTNGDNNDQVLLSTTHRRKINRIRKQLRVLCNLIFKNTIAAIASSESNNRHNSQIWDFWKAKIRATITKPIGYCLRDLKSSSIYSSYDWVSEIVIDIHGNRLILPGSCVDLDYESENSNMIDDNNSNNNDNSSDGRGTLIVASCTDSVTIKQDDDFGTRSNSPLSSTTIMVSAYDLLSVERNKQQTKRRINNNNTDTPQSLSLFETIEEDHHGGSRDCRYYYRDDDDDDYDGYNVEDYQSTMIMIATTKDITQQWKHAIWKLVKRKTNRWYCGGYFRFQQTIQCVGRLLIDSQQLLLNHNSNSNNGIHRRALLLLLSNSNANSNRKGVLLETNDRDKTDEQEVSDSTIFGFTQSSQYTTSTRTIKDDEGAVVIEMSSCKSNICIRTLHQNEL